MPSKIGLVLALDGEKEFKSALTSAKQAASALKSEVKAVGEAFDGQANTLEALTAKHEALSRQQDSLKARVAAARTGLDQANETYRKQADRLEELRTKLDAARKAQQKMEEAGDTSSDAYKEQTEEVERLQEAVTKQASNTSAAASRVAKWGSEVDSANRELTECNKELAKNEQYMDEAASSADGCARSIDGMGDEIKETGDQAEDAGGKVDKLDSGWKTAFKVAAVGLATKALQELGRKAIEAAKYVVKVGSDFEASMSKVEALSGASASDMDLIAKKAQQLGASTQFSATEVGDAFGYMALAGWDVSSMLDGVDGVVNLAAAGQMDLARASDIVTDNLTAFGLSASDSGRMVDVMAYAMAHSNTDVDQLGEAYKNVAATCASMGISMEDATAVLMVMANAGIKGGEAGTALNAIMTRLATDTKGCASALEEYGVSIYDSEGNMASLSDILGGMSGVWSTLTQEQQASMAKAIAGQSHYADLQVIMAGLAGEAEDGESAFSNYAQQLDNCAGSAEDMRITMTDNLQGDVKGLNSALEGLGIRLYSYVQGPLRSLVQTATGVIRGITDALTPQKTELETFIEDVENSNKHVQELLGSADEHMAEGKSKVADLEAYKSVLLELNGITMEGGTLDEFQIYQARNAVDALSEVMPGLRDHFDETTGAINLTNEQLTEMFANTEALVMQEALIAAQKDSYDALAEAMVAKAKADAAVKQATDDLTAAEEKNQASTDYLTGGFGDYYREVLDAEVALEKATSAQEDADAGMAAAQKNIDETNAALENLTEEYGLLGDQQSEVADTSADVSKSQEEQAETAKSLAKTYEDLQQSDEDLAAAAKASAEAQKEAIEAVKEAYEGFYDRIKQDMESQIDILKPFEPPEETTSVDEMISNVEGQMEMLANWRDNMATLWAEVEKGTISPEFYQHILEQGPAYASAVEAMVADVESTAEGEVPKLAQLSEQWGEAMDLSEQTARAQALNETSLALAANALGSSAEEYEEAIQTITDAASLEGWSPDVRKQINSLVAMAQRMGVALPKGFAEGIANGSSTPAVAMAPIAGAIDGQVSEVVRLAESAGLDVPEELKAGIEAGNPAAIAAYQQLISDLAQMESDAQETGQTAGEGAASGMVESLESGQADAGAAAEGIGTAVNEGLAAAGDGIGETGTTAGQSYVSGLSAATGDASAAGESLSQAATQGVSTAEANLQAHGTAAGQSFASGISSGAGSAMAAGYGLGSAAVSGASAYTGSAWSIGYNIAAGVASGISSGASAAISAAASMASSALAAAKAKLEIQSPSKAFRKQVGHQIARGMAFGIKDKASLASKEADKMSAAVLSKATKWMAKYKKAHKVSAQDSLYYWQQVQKHVKKGTDAYKAASKNIEKALLQTRGLSAATAKKITSNFGVSWFETKGTGKNAKKVKKSVADYYGDVYSAADKYYSNWSKLSDWSTQKEITYWTGVRKRLKKGTQAWIDATLQIKDLKAQQAEEVKNQRAAAASSQDSALAAYKVYNANKVSMKAEWQYWEQARKAFKTGTQERIDADQKYYEAKQAWYDALKDLDKNYAEDTKQINDQLKADVKDLQQAYKDAVADRKRDIMSQMDLFEAFDAEGYTGEQLLANLKTQVAGLALWERELGELEKRKGVPKDLIESLQEMGVDAAANIYSLNHMTDQQLSEYVDLWKQKSALATAQAVKESETLRKETDEQIKQLRATAKAELDELTKEWKAQRAELNGEISKGLATLATKAAKIGEEAAVALARSLTSEVVGYESYKSTQKVVNMVSDGLKDLPKAGKTIGQSTLDGILSSLTDPARIQEAAETVVNSIKKAMQEAALIHSPSRLFRDEVGSQIDAGLAMGIEAGQAAEAARQNVHAMLEAAREALAQEGGTLSYSADLSGVEELGRMVGDAGSGMSLNIDTSGITGGMSAILARMDRLEDAITGMGVYVDGEALVGQIQPAMSVANAAASVRSSRGRL